MKHQDIIQQLTLDEKCYLLSGRDFWSTRTVEHAGVPSMTMSDGPHGLRKQENTGNQLGFGGSLPATCFPTAATISNSWDPALGEEIGKCLGEEALTQDVCVLLGPGLNMKRNPLCGRNFEYFSEDPYLAGKMAAGYIRGIQSKGISACPKHFAANNCELRRQTSDSIMDERTLREIYLTAFEIAVKEAAPRSIMSSYNRINGVYSSENPHLLQEILRDEWGFDGFVVTDWGACNDFVDGIRAGANLEMPSTCGDSPEQLKAAVQEGRISQDIVDQRVDELLDVVLSTRAACKTDNKTSFDINAHHSMAQSACEQSIVLLKNEGSILPLQKGSRVAVIGDFAKTPRYQGAGSSLVNPTKLDSTMDVIGNFDLDVVGYEPGFPRTGPGDSSMEASAVELASKADFVLMYLGLDEYSESEGLDRIHMRIPQSQVDLLNAVHAVNENIIVILAAGSSVEMPWLDQCRALVHGYLCGQAGASAILRVLLGEVNPSGKLTETYPVHYEDTPSAPYFPAKQRTVEYREGLYIGYRYFETAKVPVLFPFGYGLSYTTFSYQDLKVCPQKAVFTLTNTGSRDGSEVAQLYVSARCHGVFRPVKELKGFAKVFLKTGESRTVTIPLDDKAFRYFNVKTGRFEIEGGDYEILIGASVEDIRLHGTVSVEGTSAPLPYDMNRLPSYATGQVQHVSDEEFRSLLGHEIPDGSWNGPLQMNDSLCQLYYAKSHKAHLVYRFLTRKVNKGYRQGKPDLNVAFVYDMPFRAIGKLTSGLISQEMCRGLVTIVNGHAVACVKGLRTFIRGYRKQKGIVRKASEMK